METTKQSSHLEDQDLVFSDTENQKSKASRFSSKGFTHLHIPNITTRTKRYTVLIVVTITFFILLAVGLTLFFLWPRNPTLEYQNGIHDVHISYSPSSLSLLINFTEQYTINNNNYVALDVRDSVLSVYYNQSNIGFYEVRDKTFDIRSSGYINQQVMINSSNANSNLEQIIRDCESRGDSKRFFTLDFDGWVGCYYFSYSTIVRTRFHHNFSCPASSSSSYKIKI